MSSAKNLQKLWEKLRKTQAERKHLLRTFCRDSELIAGSYAEVLIRCGQPTCHCHKDGGHFATRLSRWVDGKLKSQIVRVDDREWVKSASDLYKEHKVAIKEIRYLQKTELEILKEIVETKIVKYR